LDLQLKNEQIIDRFYRFFILGLLMVFHHFYIRYFILVIQNSSFIYSDASDCSECRIYTYKIFSINTDMGN